MLVEIIKELIKTEESKDVTSEQVLAWAKRVEAQKAQSAIINSLKETKDFNRIKTLRGGRRESHKLMPKYPQSRVAVIMVPAIHPDNAQPVARSVQDVVKSITLEQYAEV